MTVQSPTTTKLSDVKPTGLYLMELRRHFAELTSRRQKLAVASWGGSEAQSIPILDREHRLAKAQA
jgi:hypothetical protein